MKFLRRPGEGSVRGAKEHQHRVVGLSRLVSSSAPLRFPKPRRGKGFIFLAHQDDPRVAARALKLMSALGEEDHLYVLLDSSEISSISLSFLNLLKPFPNVTAETFSVPDLEKKHGVTLLNPGHIYRGSTHLPVLDVSVRTRHKFYWTVEWDVLFKGHWEYFFKGLPTGKKDLIAFDFRTKQTSPDWYWWSAAISAPKVTEDDFFAAFFPVWGTSAKLMQRILTSMRRGWYGHCEVVIPTILAQFRARFHDLNETPLVTQSSFRYRPEISKEEFDNFPPDTVCHPVKDVEIL